MDGEFPEGFPAEKWSNILLYAHQRILEAGGMDAVLPACNGSKEPEEGSVEEIAGFERLVRHVKKMAAAGIGSTIPKPSLPQNDRNVAARLKCVQTYLNRLEYNHLGTPFFIIRKSASVRSLMRTAQEIVRYGLPIKCLEAAVVGMLLTAGIDGIDRITCSFKSQVGSEVYRHIVLLIRHGDRWGALGLSRRKDLMDKPLTFQSLPEILMEYRTAYERNQHCLIKAKLGLPVPHDTSSNERIAWKYLSLRFPTSPYQSFTPQATHSMDRFIRGIRGGFKPVLVDA
ncbi:hypothetical protein SpCBS45565_g02822 [Spizellomyces sp. 'palustris']|nr:hypothetical protein SpCBS45565_g02822 [Spizellomyces sp. 'palustris']